MRKDQKGKPSGVNKEESQTGIPSNITSGEQNKVISEKYTSDINKIRDNVLTVIQTETQIKKIQLK